MSEATLYRMTTHRPDYDACWHVPTRSGCCEVDVWFVPVEPDIDAAKAESDRQQGGPGLSRHKIAKIVNAAYAGIGANDG